MFALLKRSFINPSQLAGSSLMILLAGSGLHADEGGVGTYKIGDEKKRITYSDSVSGSTVALPPSGGVRLYKQKPKKSANLKTAPTAAATIPTAAVPVTNIAPPTSSPSTPPPQPSALPSPAPERPTAPAIAAAPPPASAPDAPVDVPLQPAVVTPGGGPLTIDATTGGIPIPAGIRGKGYRVVENWDFGATVRTQPDLYSHFFTRFIWNNGKLDTLSSNGEWQRFRDRDNHRLDGDTLKLIAHVRGGLYDGGIESGMLRSKRAFKHGYFEARIRVPNGRGQWTAFWLNPQDTGWPPEIDIVEILNNGRDDSRVSYHFLHSGQADKGENITSKLNEWNGYRPGFDYKDGFHIFAVDWTQDTVRHYVDNMLIAERGFGWKHDDGSDGGLAHILLTLSVGGKWPGPPTSVKAFPAMLEVDYIRVWQK